MSEVRKYVRVEYNPDAANSDGYALGQHVLLPETVLEDRGVLERAFFFATRKGPSHIIGVDRDVRYDRDGNLLERADDLDPAPSFGM